MKFIHYLTYCLILIMYSCGNDSDRSVVILQKESNKSVTETNKVIPTDTTELIIQGNNIWVRTVPFSGKIIMKLNSGDVCKILEKGKKVQIKDKLDHWYKIKYNDTIGWVFGSQTNLNIGETVDILNFSKYLETFIPVFNVEQNDLKSFEHKDIPYMFLFNPGVYCSGGPHSPIEIYLSKPIPAKSIFKNTPDGDFCEGYPGVKDGFYYQNISVKMLPSYVAGFDKDADVIIEKISVPNKYRSNEIKKVYVISDEYHYACLYFLNIGNTWYLICFDFCDCSA